MKTDTIFYSLFQEFPSFFFELIDRQMLDRPQKKMEEFAPSIFQ
ncbi:MAG: Rpn family recombination-promoting nuclease/putative transposase [Oscillatoriaceae cyanobacterium Prado104]|jgi:predicted transposase YdaD|nr:Rpn family recombination-promoting nuclease/putative transposase [Oscillatoriaceae cyanobacterium Prado104]